MSGMDQFSTIPTWISAIAAASSTIFAIISWRQSNGSKEAKAKADEAHKAALDMRDAAERSAKAAEEQANQAEESLKQMQQIVAEQQSQSQSQSKIADSLRGPVLELIKEPGNCNYTLRNNTESSIKILEALNHKSFYYDVYSDELAEIPKEVHPGKPIDLPLPHTASVRSLDLRIEINGEEKILSVEIPR